MAKKKDLNVFEMHNKLYTIAERAREESDVRMIPYTIKQYIDKVDNGEIRRDAFIQRTNDQWTVKQKSKLAEAVLHNRPIGNIALAKGRTGSKNYAITSLVDGLQRTTALVDFYHDKFALDKRAKPVICRCVDEEGNIEKIEIEIAGKKYSQLPDALKVFFDEYKLTAYMYEGFTDEELDDIVFCMNNGKTPNAYQKMRFLLGSENMRLLQPICDSTLWEDVKGCKAKNDSILCCVIRTLMMMTHYNYTNLGSAAMSKFVDNDFDNYVTTGIINKLSSLVEELAEIKCELSDDEIAYFNSTTFPHYIIGLDEFHKNDTAGEYIDFLREFWNSDDYNTFLEACDSNGSGGSLYSAESVENRQYAIYDCIDKYFGVDDNDNDAEESETTDNNSRDNTADISSDEQYQSVNELICSEQDINISDECGQVPISA